MSKKIVVGMIAVVIFASAMIAALPYSEVLAQEQRFTAQLTGQVEVPPTNSQATGMAEFTVVGQSIEYTVNASNIQGVTAGHIHAGKPGENGPIIATLFENDSPANKVSETGSITADTGAFQYVTDLTTPMNDGETYVNLHTEQNPDGEIRGQIMSTSSGGSPTSANSTG
jgi:hypothetical protein